MNAVPTFVEANMPYGCEGGSVRLAGIYFRMALQSEFKERVLSGTIDKTLWKKVYLSFMRKNGVDIYTDRHAFQVLYALSRHYNVCRVNKTSITWTSRTEHAARANLTIGELREDLHWAHVLLDEFHNAQQNVAEKPRCRRFPTEEGEILIEGNMSPMTLSELAV
jgi:hypothetical protein